MEAGTTDMVLTQAGPLTPLETAVVVWIGLTGNNFFLGPTIDTLPIVPFELTIN